MTFIRPSDLIEDWQNFANVPFTQKLGDMWIKNASSAILKVPSVIIPEEHNYILNPTHKDFSKIKYIGNEPFKFDTRIKGSQTRIGIYAFAQSPPSMQP